MESLEEFKKRTLKVQGPKKHKIRGSLGIYSGYKYYRKNKPKEHKYILTESQYFAITRRVNDLLAEELISGEEITLPHRMGTLEVRKIERNIRIGKDGEIITNLPIDWDSTLKLWYEDEESYKNKTIVRQECSEIFTIYYSKANANYTNKTYYQFVINRDLKKRFKQKIKDGKMNGVCHLKYRRYGQ